jgi:tripartite-type tricarboxylate transporter receptor subunit TctC
MDHGRRRLLQFAGAVMAAPTLVRRALAQGYPARAVRVVVPFAPGGITDVLARLIAEKWSENLGRQFYVENVTGGSGNIGMGQAAKAAPDGYTILTAFVSYVVNPALFAKVPYDPVRDFDPIGLAVTSTTVLVVNPQVHHIKNSTTHPPATNLALQGTTAVNVKRQLHPGGAGDLRG